VIEQTGHVSPDGNWRWNGTQWVPNAPGPAVVAQKKGHMGRNLGIGCLGLIILVVIIGVAASSGNKSSNNTSSGGSSGGGNNQTTGTCSPKPCANADGFTVTVSGVNRNLPAGEFNKPEAGNHFVAMQVTLHNGSSDKKSANPFDFKLRDANGQEHDIAFSTDPACGTWQAVELANAASLGPKPLCFEASGTPDKPLTVIWSPGFFSSKVEIPLQ